MGVCFFHNDPAIGQRWGDWNHYSRLYAARWCVHKLALRLWPFPGVR